MISARARHNEALRRKDAVHLFSDELPFFRLVEAWLLEQKLDDDLSSLEGFRTASTRELLDQLPDAPKVERRAGGLFVGTVHRADLNSPGKLTTVMKELSGAYRDLDSQFLAPYVDLTA